MNLDRKKNLLLICLAAETISASYGLLLGPDAVLVSILYIFFAGAFILLILNFPSAQLPAWKDLRGSFRPRFLISASLIILAFFTSRYWMEEIPIDPDFADMLPIIRVMNERFLRGDIAGIYAPVNEVWNGAIPIYLPAMWLPYFPAVALHVDIRWITVISLLLSFMIILFLVRSKKLLTEWALIAISLILFWWVFSRNDIHSLITMTEEGPVIFYFTLLTLAIISGNAYCIGIMTSLCLLSRYSMIGWVLPCCLYFIHNKNIRKFLIFSVTITCFFLIFLLIPFGYKVIHQMIFLPGAYIHFAGTVWENSPDVFWLNLGLAKFYGAQHVRILHNCLVVLSFGIPAAFMVFCLYQKKWKLHNINLACFKLSVLVFYQLIDVPYGYLFYTGLFVSLAAGSVLVGAKGQQGIPENNSYSDNI